jgi:hypothetical protein
VPAAPVPAPETEPQPLRSDTQPLPQTLPRSGTGGLQADNPLNGGLALGLAAMLSVLLLGGAMRARRTRARPARRR